MKRREFLKRVTAGSAGIALGAPRVAGNAASLLQRRVSAGGDADDARMAWWRDARFGMFIHFGLYSTLGGEWKGQRAGSHEWIRNNYKIPHEEYIQLVKQFNPAGFEADAWVAAAKDAGQKYIVVTTKHHEGFSLFDSAVTTYDVMSTPFKRDIMKEIANACRRHGVRIGWYYSIMDWYHPDYLPRRDWENRSSAGADFSRYVAFMKAQLRELLTKYGDISVLWFDGQWENTWNHQLGVSLYDYCRSIAPNVIINDRVDAGLPKDASIAVDSTMADSARARVDRHAGDFTTPEQQVPANGLPGVDWESCMTMNDNWGYSKFDHNYKSVEQLISLLVDTSSRGGNLLLNVGPMGDGRFPPESIERLRGVGAWMRVNGNAIYGSRATPFVRAPFVESQPDINVRVTSQQNRLNVFMSAWHDGALVLPGLFTRPRRVFPNADRDTTFEVQSAGDAIAIELPERGVSGYMPVIAMEFDQAPVIR